MPPVLVRPYVMVIANHQPPPATHLSSPPVTTRTAAPQYRPKHSWSTASPHGFVPAPVPGPISHRKPRHYPALAWTVLVLALAMIGLAVKAGDRAATSGPDTEPVTTAAQAGRLQIAFVPAPGVAALGTAPAAQPVAGPLIGPGGLCLDARFGAVALHRCTGAAAQTWTAHADGTLRTASRCLQPAAGRLGLVGCTGGTAQQWQAVRGTLVARSSRQCLTTGRDGARLYLAHCAGAANQRWQLP